MMGGGGGREREKSEAKRRPNGPIIHIPSHVRRQVMSSWCTKDQKRHNFAQDLQVSRSVRCGTRWWRFSREPSSIVQGGAGVELATVTLTMIQCPD